MKRINKERKVFSILEELWRRYGAVYSFMGEIEISFLGGSRFRFISYPHKEEGGYEISVRVENPRKTSIFEFESKVFTKEQKLDIVDKFVWHIVFGQLIKSAEKEISSITFDYWHKARLHSLEIDELDPRIQEKIDEFIRCLKS